MPRKKTETQPIEGLSTVVDPPESKGEVAPVVVQSPVLSLIERASKDPSVDIDKMERLIAMQERMQDRQGQVEYDNAMAAAQEEMEPVRTDAPNQQTRSKYATYAALDRAIRPVYTKHGFSISFNSAPSPHQDNVRIVCRVSHRVGHREIHELDMPADGKGAKGGDVMTRTHAMGSAVSYGKRYLLSMVFNLATTNDDDGNAAGGRRRQDDDVENLKDNRKKGTVDKEVAQPMGGAKNFIDYAIQMLNHGTVLEEVQTWARENAKYLRWVYKFDRDQYDRYDTAFKNTVEALSKKSAGEAKARQSQPQADQPEDAAGDKTADTSSSSEGGSGISGEKGQNSPAPGPTAARAEPAVELDDTIPDEPIDVFQKFGTYGELVTVSTEWLGNPDRTPEEAQRWHEFHKVRLEYGVSPKYGNAKVKESILELLALYGKVVAQEE